MASPAVGGITEGGLTAAGTNLAVTLPSGGSASDEYIVIIAKGSVSCTINALANWTEILDESVAAGLAVIRYTGSGVPSNPTFVTSASSRSVWGAYRITGADKATAPEIGTTATGTSTTPNPPSRAVTGGPKDILAIAFFASGASENADDDSLVTTFPTNYTLGQIEKTGGTTGTNLAGLLGSAARQVSAVSSEDPGTFTQNASRAWRANTLVVHPVVLVTSGEYVFSLTNPAAPPDVDTDHSVTVRAWATAGSGSLLVRLLQGGTELDSWTETLTGSAADYVHNLAEAVAANITDYNDLRIGVRTQGATGLTVRVSQQYVSFPEGSSTDKNTTGRLSVGSLISTTMSKDSSPTGRLASASALVASVSRQASVSGSLGSGSAQSAAASKAPSVSAPLFAGSGQQVATVGKGLIASLSTGSSQAASHAKSATVDGGVYAALVPVVGQIGKGLSAFLPVGADLRTTVTRTAETTGRVDVASNIRATSGKDASVVGVLPSGLWVFGDAIRGIITSGLLSVGVDLRTSVSKTVDVGGRLASSAALYTPVAKQTDLSARLYAAAGTWTPVTSERPVSGHLGAAAWTFTPTWNRGVAAYLGAGVDLRSTVSKTVSVDGRLYASSDARAAVSHLVSTTGWITVGVWPMAFLIPDTDKLTTGRLWVDGVLRAALTHDSTPSGLLVVSSAQRATVTRTADVSGRLSTGLSTSLPTMGRTATGSLYAATHVRSTVTRTAQSSGRLDASGQIYSLVTRTAQTTGSITIGSYSYALTASAVDHVTSGLLWIATDLRSLVSRTTTVSGRLDVASGLRAPVSHDSLVATRLWAAAAARSPVSHAANVAASLTAGSAARSIPTREALTIALLSAAVALHGEPEHTAITTGLLTAASALATMLVGEGPTQDGDLTDRDILNDLLTRRAVEELFGSPTPPSNLLTRRRF